MQIAVLQAPLETVFEVALALIVPAQKGEVDRAMVQLKNEEIITIGGDLSRRGQAGIQDMFAHQRDWICTAEVLPRRVHPPAIRWNKARAVQKPERNLEAKIPSSFESSHLVYLALHIQKMEVSGGLQHRLGAFQLNPELIQNLVVATGNRALVGEIKFCSSLSRTQPKGHIESCKLFLGDHWITMEPGNCLKL